MVDADMLIGILSQKRDNFRLVAGYASTMEDAIWAIKDAPTINEPETRHEKWIPIHASIYPYGFDVKCSWCKQTIFGGAKGYNYCPNCGSKMDGD